MRPISPGALVEQETGLVESQPFPTEIDIDEKELKDMLRESVRGKTPEVLSILTRV